MKEVLLRAPAGRSQHNALSRFVTSQLATSSLHDGCSALLPGANCLSWKRISVLQLLDELFRGNKCPVCSQEGFTVQHQIYRERQGSLSQPCLQKTKLRVRLNPASQKEDTDTDTF